MPISFHLKVGGITLERTIANLEEANTLLQLPAAEKHHTLAERIKSKVRMFFNRGISSDSGLGALIHGLKGDNQKLISPNGRPVIVQIIKREEDGREEVQKAGFYNLRFNEMRPLTKFEKHVALDPTIDTALAKVHQTRLDLVRRIDSWYLTRGRRNAALTKARSVYDTAMTEFKAKFGDEHRAAMHRSFDEVQYDKDDHREAIRVELTKKMELNDALKNLKRIDLLLKEAMLSNSDLEADLRGQLAQAKNKYKAAHKAHKTAKRAAFDKRDQSLSQQMLDIADRAHLQMIRVLLRKDTKKPMDTTATVNFFEKNFAAFNTAEIRGFIDSAFGVTVRKRFQFATKNIPGIAGNINFPKHFGQITTKGAHWAFPLHKFLKKDDFEEPTQANLAQLAADLKKREWSFCR